MMEGAPRSPLGRDGLSPPQRAEVNPLGATVITGAGSIDDGETCDEPTTTMATTASRRTKGASRALPPWASSTREMSWRMVRGRDRLGFFPATRRPPVVAAQRPSCLRASAAACLGARWVRQCADGRARGRTHRTLRP